MAEDCFDDGSERLCLPYVGVIGMENGRAGVGPTGNPSYSTSELLEVASSCGDGVCSSSLLLRLESDGPIDEPLLSDSDSLEEANDDDDDDDDEVQDLFLHSFLEVLGSTMGPSLLSSSAHSLWKFALDCCSPCCIVGVGTSSRVNGDSVVFPSSLPDGIDPGGSTDLLVKSQ